MFLFIFVLLGALSVSSGNEFAGDLKRDTSSANNFTYYGSFQTLLDHFRPQYFVKVTFVRLSFFDIQWEVSLIPATPLLDLPRQFRTLRCRRSAIRLHKRRSRWLDEMDRRRIDGWYCSRNECRSVHLQSSISWWQSTHTVNIGIAIQKKLICWLHIATLYRNASFENMEYLSVEQSLADIATFVRFVRAGATVGYFTKVILWGSGYGASMATWARKKYPGLIDAVGFWIKNILKRVWVAQLF